MVNTFIMTQNHPYALKPLDLHALRSQGFEIRLKTKEEIEQDLELFDKKHKADSEKRPRPSHNSRKRKELVT